MRLLIGDWADCMVRPRPKSEVCDCNKPVGAGAVKNTQLIQHLTQGFYGVHYTVLLQLVPI